MTEFQIFAVDHSGAVVHCGPKKYRRFTQKTALRHEAEWRKWQKKIANETPDCPTALIDPRSVVALIVHPVGKPEESRRFPIESPRPQFRRGQLVLAKQFDGSTRRGVVAQVFRFTSGLRGYALADGGLFDEWELTAV